MEILNLTVIDESIAGITEKYSCFVKIHEKGSSVSKQQVEFGQDDEESDPLPVDGRTLFLASCYPYFSYRSYEKLFGRMNNGGEDESVSVQAIYLNCGAKRVPLSKDRGLEYIGWSSSLHIVLDRPVSKSALASFCQGKSYKFKPFGGVPSVDILERMKNGFQNNLVLSPDAMMNRVNIFMHQYEQAEKRVQAELAAISNTPDEDGFILVTRHHRKGVNRDAEGNTVSAFNPRSEQALMIQERTVGKKSSDKDKPLDFYRFQVREKKREQLAELKRKFAEDRAKISKLKEARKFKPY